MSPATPESNTSVTDERPVDDDSGSGLKREVGPGMLAIYGAGTILGAGIYVLIGEVAGRAGYWLPAAFLVAAVVAGVNGMTYAELSTRMPRAGGPTSYVGQAFDRRWFTVIIGWMIVITGVVSAATITTGFSGYVTAFVDLPPWLVRSVLLVGIAGVAVAGAKQSAWFMAITTALGLVGLSIVLGVGFFSGAAEPGRVFAEAGSLGDMKVLGGLAAASFLAVYAFIGFEDMVHMAEEVKHPERSMPIAISTAIGIAAVLYVIVAFAALSLMDPQGLAEAKAPLVDVAEAGGFPGWPVAILSLWIILNGALAQVIMASRVMYDLSDRRGGAPSLLGQVWDRTSTPVPATLVGAGVALLLALTLPLDQLASITSFVMLLVFAASNVALIRLEGREPEAPFDTPKWLPWLGLVVTVVLMIGTFFVGGGG